MMDNFSDFIVYVDESGDHEMININRQFPVFALAFCVTRKNDYINMIVPAVQQFKFNVWGHDSIILHEHEIRKSLGSFEFLRTNRKLRDCFFDDLKALMEDIPTTIYASVIDKKKHRTRYATPWNPYEIALHFCMEQLHTKLTTEKQHGKTVHVIFESRGAKEDTELEREFRRIADNNSHWRRHCLDFSQFDLQPVSFRRRQTPPACRLPT